MHLDEAGAVIRFALRPIARAHERPGGRFCFPRIGYNMHLVAASRQTMRQTVGSRAHPTLNGWILSDQT